MDMPAESAASDVLLDNGVYTLAALGADRTTTDISAALGAMQQQLVSAASGRSAAEEAATAASALAMAAEVEAEGIIRRIESRVLEVVNKKRGVDPYARLFPGNLDGAISPAGRAQAAAAAHIADLIAPAAGPRLAGVTDEIANLGPELREKTAALLTRIAGLEAAEAAAVAAYGAELTCRRQWREQYRRTQALLTVLYPTDRRKVESFFRPGKRAKKKPA